MADRKDALEALQADLGPAARGKRVVLVGGEPGIGKTRLVSEFAGTAYAGGAVVLYGRSGFGEDPPYQPFAEAISHYLSHAPAEVVEQCRDDMTELARVIPEAREKLAEDRREGAGAADADRYRFFGAVGSLLACASREAPVVLILEDLHWADEGTVQLLRNLISGPYEIAGLVVGTYRNTDVRPNDPLAGAVADLGRESEVSRIDLEPLSSEDSLVLLTDLAGRGLSGAGIDTATAIHRESGGNPLFLTELVRALVDAGAMRESSDGWTIDQALEQMGLPKSVTEVISQRVTGLGATVRELLEAASVIGQEFDPDVVEFAVDLSAEEMGAACDAAEGAGLVVEVEPGLLAFSHPLVVRSIYRDLGSRRRGQIHRRVAEGLEARGWDSDAAELARHWSEAAPAELVKARDWAARAGSRALDRFDGAAATRWFERALELHERGGGDDERVRCELLVGRGHGERHSGSLSFRDTLLEASRLAAQLGDEELLVEAALLNNRGFASGSGMIDEERIAILELALRTVGNADSRERALLLATLAIELTFSGEWERRVELSDEALSISRRLGDRPTLARVLTTRFVTIWMPGTLDERLANAAEAVRLADELGDPWTQFHAVRWRFVGLVQAGEIDDAGPVMERADGLARRLGDPTTGWMSTYDRATLAIIAGRLDDAERLAQQALELASGSGPLDPMPIFTSQIASIRYEQGRLPELQPLIAKVVAETPGVPGLRAYLALSYAEADLGDEAEAVLDVDLATEFAEIPADPVWLATIAIYAHVAADLGNGRAAEALYALLAPWRDQVVYAGVGAWGTVELVLGRLATVLGRHDEAEQHLTAALDHARRIGAPIWAARACLEIASVLLARDAEGDRERGAAALEDAIAGSARCGAVTVDRRARSLRDHQRAMEIVASAGSGGQRLRMRAPAANGGGEDGGLAPTPGPARVAGKLAHQGDSWAIRLGDREVQLRDGKGVRYLAELLSNPGVEMHAADLQRGNAGVGEAPAGTAVDAGLSIRGTGSEHAGEVLDEQAKRNYRSRIDDLREEIAEAESFNDPERASRAKQELDFLGGELAAAVGLGGRDRKAASQAERARVNVTRALRGTLRRIADHNEELGSHLDVSVQTGTFCAYQPPPGQELEWAVEGADGQDRT